jgi:hypothetical protein
MSATATRNGAADVVEHQDELPIEAIVASINAHVETLREKKRILKRDAKRLLREAEDMDAEIERNIQARDLLAGQTSAGPKRQRAGHSAVNVFRRKTTIVDALALAEGEGWEHHLRRSLGYGSAAMREATIALHDEGWVERVHTSNGPGTAGIRMRLLREAPYVEGSIE